jgi:hypothetical protein
VPCEESAVKVGSIAKKRALLSEYRDNKIFYGTQDRGGSGRGRKSEGKEGRGRSRERGRQDHRGKRWRLPGPGIGLGLELVEAEADDQDQAGQPTRRQGNNGPGCTANDHNIWCASQQASGSLSRHNEGKACKCSDANGLRCNN